VPAGGSGGGTGGRPRIIRLNRITDPIPDGADLESTTGPASDPVGAPRADSPADLRTNGVLSDDALMGLALDEARHAAAIGEVPVGAVVARNGRVLVRAHNLRETSGDPTAHAEIVALREAARRLGTWHLEGLTLFVTLEPCFMCAGALVNARVERLVFGASDPKAGAVGSLGDVVRDARLNHRLDVTSGVRAGECGEILRDFFAARRRPS